MYTDPGAPESEGAGTRVHVMVVCHASSLAQREHRGGSVLHGSPGLESQWLHRLEFFSVLVCATRDAAWVLGSSAVGMQACTHTPLLRWNCCRLAMGQSLGLTTRTYLTLNRKCVCAVQHSCSTRWARMCLPAATA